MIPQPFDYSAPTTIKEALGLLSADGAKALAGGMSLVPMMKLRLAAPALLVDLGRIGELKNIRESAGFLHIGATATHYDVESSALVRGRCPLLAQAAASIGDVQVRNSGTIGGSVAHADPAADYPAALFALDAKVRILSAKSDRTLGIGEFLVDTFTTALEPGEIVTEVIVPVEEPGTGTAYRKMVQPASGFAIVGAAARIRRSNGSIAMARIGITGLGGKAFRASGAEAALEGTAGGEAEIRKAAASVAGAREAFSDLNATAGYRKAMAAVYAARAIASALEKH